MNEIRILSKEHREVREKTVSDQERAPSSLLGNARAALPTGRAAGKENKRTHDKK